MSCSRDGLDSRLIPSKPSHSPVSASRKAEGAGELIQAAVCAIKLRMTVAEVSETFHPYVTVAEGLKLAAQTFDRDVAMLSCCAA